MTGVPGDLHDMTSNETNELHVNIENHVSKDIRHILTGRAHDRG